MVNHFIGDHCTRLASRGSRTWHGRPQSYAPYVRCPEPIWVITDASGYGVGALYGQGTDWETCQPAGFMSKKFTVAQRSYRTFEHEALGVIEALMKWEDKLVG